MSIDLKALKSRAELKRYFAKNERPTESQFAELIDGLLSQKDDGIARPKEGDPLSIEASGAEDSTKKVINFYQSFADANPSWVLSLKAQTNPAKPGLTISDGNGKDRLFIDQKSGNVGIGTVTPGAPLEVNGNVKVNGSVSFGSRLGEHVVLWGTTYTIGVQHHTQYFRTATNFAWFKGGTHDKEALNPGGSGTLAMVLADGRLGLGFAAKEVPSEAILHLKKGDLRIQAGKLIVDVGSITAGGAITGGSLTVTGSVTVTGALSFTEAKGEFLKLRGDDYTIGMQAETQYFRSAGNFAWFTKGKHTSDNLNPGAGGTLAMVLSGGKLGLGLGNGAMPQHMLHLKTGDLRIEKGSVNVDAGSITAGGAITGGSLTVTGNATITSGSLKVQANHDSPDDDIATFLAQNGTMGIGIRFERIVAVGTAADVPIALVPKGAGAVSVLGHLTVQSGKKVSGIPIIDWKAAKVDFTGHTGSRKTMPYKVNFNRAVQSAQVMLQAWDLHFTDKAKETRIHNVAVKCETPTINGQDVTGNIEFSLKDATGVWDDSYAGEATVVVIARVETAF